MLLKQYHKVLSAFASKICGMNNIDHLCKLYRDIVFKTQRHHGRKYMVQRMKDLNSIAERYSIHQPIEPIKFLKSDVDGFPNVLSPFKAYLRNEDPNVVKITLSIFRSVEIFRLPPHHDISTVVRQPSYDEKVVKDIILHIPRFVTKLSKLRYEDMVYHYTVKNGPNGPALASSDKDLSAVRQDADIYNALRTVSAKLNDTDFPDENYQVTMPGIHSRLTQFSEKAGKTRTIAVVDYYSQRALRPLHTALMAVLRGLSSDGTYSHNSVGNYAKEATKNKSFIATSDMTSFTDLFPAIIQYELLLKIVKDRDLAEAWWTLLAKRNFRVAWSGEYVSYGTGQPMGAYASWPLCTLAHHLVMDYSAYKCRIRDHFKYYRILGDDNERTDPVLSNFYEKTLLSLGCELNPYKGTCSSVGAEYSGAEVAKRLYLNGVDLSPLTPGLIKSVANLNLLNSSIKNLAELFEDPALPFHVLETIVPKNKRDKAWMLCTNPYDGYFKPGIPGYEEHAYIWSDLTQDDEYIEVYRRFRIKSLVDIATSMHSDPGGLLGEWVRLQTEPQSPVLSGEGDMELNIQPQYASTKCAKHMMKKLFRAIQRLKAPYHLIDDNALGEVEYMPNPKAPFMELKDLRTTRATLLVQKSFDFLEAGEDVYDLRWVVPPSLNL